MENYFSFPEILSQSGFKKGTINRLRKNYIIKTKKIERKLHIYLPDLLDAKEKSLTKIIPFNDRIGINSTIINDNINVTLKNLYENSLVKLWLPESKDCSDQEICNQKGFTENILANSWFSVTKKVSKGNPNLNKVAYKPISDFEKEKVKFAGLPVKIRKPNRTKDQINADNELKKKLKEEQKLAKEAEKERKKNEPKVKRKITKDKANPPDTKQRTKKIRVYPTQKLKDGIKHAFGVTRFIYNKCVELVCRNKTVKEVSKLLRILVTDCEDNILTPEQKISFEKIPSDVRGSAILEFINAYEAQTKKYQLSGKTFFMSFKCKKTMLQQSISVRGRDLKLNKNGNLRCFSTKWGKDQFFRRSKNKFPLTIDHECKIVMNKENKFFICVPIDQKVKTKNIINKVVSLDPGCKIFQTMYDNKEQAYMIGENDANKIDSLQKIAVRMREGLKRYKVPCECNGELYWTKGHNCFCIKGNFYKKEYRECEGKELRKLKKVAARVENKIRNLISDVHHKSAKFLCLSYDKVIIPNFQTAQMARRKERVITKEITRKILRWSHYKFRQLLIHKGEIEGTEISVKTEEYTSKTCGNCFFVNEKLRGKRQFDCPNCFMSYHRDIGAARNIMILNS